MVQLLQKISIVWQFFKKLNVKLLYDPAIPSYVYISKRIENICSNRNLYRDVHSSIIHNRRKPECLSTDELKNKMWYIQSMEYCLSIKRDELTCDNMMILINIILCERNQTQRPHIVWLHFYEMSRKGKPIETEYRLEVSRGWKKVTVENDC